MKHLKHPWLILLLLALSGCKSATQTIWSSQSESVDGKWIALAHTENTDGPGINAQYTIVEMKQNLSNSNPVQILVFDEGEHKLEDLKMNWVSPSHLDVTYRGDPDILFRAIKAIGQDVTTERLSD